MFASIEFFLKILWHSIITEALTFKVLSKTSSPLLAFSIMTKGDVWQKTYIFRQKKQRQKSCIAPDF